MCIYIHIQYVHIHYIHIKYVCVYISINMCVCLCVYAQVLSHVQIFLTLWTVASQAPLSMEFSRQEYGSGLPCPPPGALPDPGIESASLMSPAWAGGLFTTSATWEALASAGVLYWEGSQETDVSGVGLQTCVLKFHRAPIYLVVFTLQLSPSVLLGT